MRAIGALKMSLACLQARSLWEQTGRFRTMNDIVR